MSLTIQKNINISRNLTTRADEKKVGVATLTGQIIPNKAISMSMVVMDEALASANRDDLAAAFDAFVVELRTLAADNGLPI